MRFDTITAAQAMIEGHRREGEARERRAIARWLRFKAHTDATQAEIATLLHLAAAIENDEHDAEWSEALEHAGIGKDDA